MSRTKLEERLDQLRQLRTAAPDDAVLSLLCKSLRDRSNLVVAEAAKVAGDLGLSALIPDLLAALDRLYEDPVKADPKCWGKTALVKTLTLLEYGESPPFLRGSRHIQMEPVWGGQEDAAAQLRATCVLALVQCNDLSRTEVLRELVEAMTDSADPVRLEAVRALEQMNGEEAALLLRLKARLGDRRPAVIGHVFDALLNLERERSMDFVAQYLKSTNPEVRDEAAFALGASRIPGALDVLIETWNETKNREFGGVLLRALSSSRQSKAIDFLLKVVRTGPSRDTALALDALKLHEQSPEIQTLVEQAKKEKS
jgi:hypothetical protein